MTLTVAALLLLGFAGVGALTGVPRLRRWPWLPLGASVVLAALLFVPTTCATGTPAGPFHDARGDDRPTSCATVLDVELPELGVFASDTVGWGLAVAGCCVALGAAVLVLGRTVRRSRDDSA